MKNEPLVTRATIIALVSALLGALVAFGVDLSDEQRAAILGIAAVVAPLVVAAVTRHRVTPVVDGAPTPTPRPEVRVHLGDPDATSAEIGLEIERHLAAYRRTFGR